MHARLSGVKRMAISSCSGWGFPLAQILEPILRTRGLCPSWGAQWRLSFLQVCSLIPETDTETDRHTNRQTQRHTHTHTHTCRTLAWAVTQVSQTRLCLQQVQLGNDCTHAACTQASHNHCCPRHQCEPTRYPCSPPCQLIQLKVCQTTFKNTAQSPSSQHMAHGLRPVVPLHPPAQSSSHTGAPSSCVLGSAPFPLHGWRLKMPTHPHWWDHTLSHSWHHRLGELVSSDVCLAPNSTHTGLTSSWNSAIVLHKYTHDRVGLHRERLKKMFKNEVWANGVDCSDQTQGLVRGVLTDHIFHVAAPFYTIFCLLLTLLLPACPYPAHCLTS